MDKPQLLLDIDHHLKTVRPAGIKAWADADVIASIQAASGEYADTFQRQWLYEGVTINLVNTLGYGTRVNDAYRFRDPETGRFIDAPDA